MNLPIDTFPHTPLPPTVDVALKDLYKRAEYLPKQDFALLEEAFQFSHAAHILQKRASGEYYIVHPIAVTALLADLRMDVDTLCAALLHDTIEDNDDVTEEMIRKKFGQVIAFLVNSVTKLSDIGHRTTMPNPSQVGHSGFNDKEVSAANLQHLILSSAEDFRALLIKLADRLHNMRTLSHLKLCKQERIADETLNVFAPLASLIGMRQWKNEMEDLSFRAVNPSAHKRITQQIASTVKGINEKHIEKICQKLTNLLQIKGVPVLKVYGRIKSPYSIMRKTSLKNLTVHELMDIVAFRVIVKHRRDCYRALGAVHSQYRYLQNSFDDYISEPKGNGYRALHTIILFPNQPNNYRAEIQIRSRSMHQVAETGIAAHWRYKNKRTLSPEAIEMIAHLKRDAEHEQQSTMLLQEMRLRSMSDEVIAYTPRGHLVRLQKGATVLDFAFHIHTDVGKSFKEALVNDQNVSIGYRLSSGDKVEIITDSHCSPEEFWFNHVVSAPAIIAIRQSLELDAFRYFEMLVQDIARQFHIPLLSKLDVLVMRTTFRRLGMKNLRDLEENLERMRILPEEVLHSIQPDLDLSLSKEQHNQRLKAVEIAAEDYNPDVQCCHYCMPIPGDVLLGVHHMDKGIIAHREGCPMLEASENTQHFTKDVQLGRSGIDNDLYTTLLECQMTHRPGMLGVITTAIGERGVNIQNVEFVSHDDNEYVLRFKLEIQHKTQIDGIEKTVDARASDMIRISRAILSIQG